ncbi:MAG: hypothetical protein ACKVQT_24560 [Burkholderiales bacterium]
MEWTDLAAAGVLLGLGAAGVEHAFAIPKNVVAGFLILLMVLALGFAGWAAWGYYCALRDEDEWE